jgi:hypothetical protein
MANIRNESLCRIIGSYRMGRRIKARDSFAFGDGATWRELLTSSSKEGFTRPQSR